LSYLTARFLRGIKRGATELCEGAPLLEPPWGGRGCQRPLRAHLSLLRHRSDRAGLLFQNTFPEHLTARFLRGIKRAAYW